jgi:hypothetical protein
MVTIYEHINYQGKSDTFGVGDVPDLRSYGWNDCLSSIRVHGHSVILFEHINFQGRSTFVNFDKPQMDSGWNDIVSSLKVV